MPLVRTRTLLVNTARCRCRSRSPSEHPTTWIRQVGQDRILRTGSQPALPPTLRSPPCRIPEEDVNENVLASQERYVPASLPGSSRALFGVQFQL
jgi:hypothetical protein